MTNCKHCKTEMTPIIEENDYQQWECRGGDHSAQMPGMGCGAFLEKRQENGWKEEWRSKENR